MRIYSLAEFLNFADPFVETETLSQFKKNWLWCLTLKQCFQNCCGMTLCGSQQQWDPWIWKDTSTCFFILRMKSLALGILPNLQQLRYGCLIWEEVHSSSWPAFSLSPRTNSENSKTEWRNLHSVFILEIMRNFIFYKLPKMTIALCY